MREIRGVLIYGGNVIIRWNVGSLIYLGVYVVLYGWNLEFCKYVVGDEDRERGNFL